MTGGIYQILNVTNGHKYVGSAINFHRREVEHLWKLKLENHDNPHLQNAYNKHGERSFEFSPLIYLEPWELIRHEQFFIDTLKPEYNICLVAGNSFGRETSDETKDRISKAKRGHEVREETRRKISKGLMGHAVSKEAREKMSKAKMGVKRGPHSKEHKANLSAAHKGRVLSKEHRANMSQALKGKPWSPARRAAYEKRYK